MPSVCIIVPCFNEGERLPVDEIVAYLKNTTHQFCFVNDGSTDRTLALLHDIQMQFPEKTTILDQPHNLGKAEAVRCGILKAACQKPFEYYGYWDADLATPLTEIDYLLPYFEQSEEIKFVVGCRLKRLGATIERVASRHYFGRVFATFASLVLNLPVYDTQCGAKIIAATWVEIIFSTPFLSQWLFDVEIFARIIQHYGYNSAYNSIVEVPLRTWIEKGNSRLKTSYLLKVPIELFQIWRKYQI